MMSQNYKALFSRLVIMLFVPYSNFGREAYLQAAMMRLEVIANSFKAEIHNHSRNGANDMVDTTSGPHHKLR